MKFGIDRTLLTKALRRCSLSGGNSISPIMSQIRLLAKEKTEEPDATDQLVLRAVNGFVGIEHIVPCRTAVPGEILVDAKRFAVGVNTMNGETVSVRLDKTRIVVESSGSRKWSDATQSTTEFPPIQEPAGATWMKIRRDLVLDILEKLTPNVLNVPDDQRALRGIYVDVFQDGNAVACVLGAHLMSIQGLRDANAEIRVERWSCLLPQPMLSLIRDAAEDTKAGDHIEFYYSDQYVWCTSENTMIAAARFAADFPDYMQLMRGLSPQRVVELPRPALLDSLKNLISVRTERAEGAMVTISATPNPHIRLEYKGLDTEFGDTIGLSEVPTTTMRFKISPEMFRQAIDSAGENPSICTTSQDQNIVLRVESGYTACLALMNISEAG